MKASKVAAVSIVLALTLTGCVTVVVEPTEAPEPTLSERLVAHFERSGFSDHADDLAAFVVAQCDGADQSMSDYYAAAGLPTDGIFTATEYDESLVLQQFVAEVYPSECE